MPRQDSTVADLDNLRQRSWNVRRPFEGQWLLNIAYYEGKQWIAFDGNRLWEPQIEGDKPVDNRIKVAVRKSIAKKLKTRPVWVGVPADGSDDEISAARFRERAFESYWLQRDMARKLRHALLWSEVVSAGFLKVTWDETLGKQVQLLKRADGSVVYDQNGPMPAHRIGSLPEGYAAEHGVAPATVGLGDVCVDFRTAFETFPDPLAGEEGLCTAGWLIDESVYSPDYVAERFGVELEPDAASSASVTMARLPNASQWESEKNGVRLREYWSLSSSAGPGKHVVWGHDEILLEEPNPYPWLPYGMIGGQPDPGGFWPIAPVTDMISPQTELNKTLAQIFDNAERIGNSPLVYWSGQQDFEWTGKPGEKIEIEYQGPDSQPFFLQVPELPGYVQNRLNIIENSLMEISGQHEVSGAQVPAGVTAAAAINLLQEADDTLLGPDIAEMEDGLRDAGRCLLWCLWKYASDERMLKLAGDDGGWDFYSFKGQDLGEPTEDQVQVGSGVPDSKAGKQAAIQDVLNMFVQYGVPISERDLRKVLQEYQVGGLEKFFASVGNTERQIQRENQLMATGEQVPINSYDEDQQHIAGHREFQRSARYAELDDVAKQIVEAHVEAHVQRATNAAMAQAPGAGGSPAGAPPVTGPPAASNGVGPPGALPSPQQPSS